ncbi:potassium voltage-gated channel subfamily G member 2 isoform X2 [Erpetoichthys calabaricus]|uniref:Potassium voltage-gated channel modifier subfamily G member 2 n=2 Tax=Erpetoichthys calabaricus TaxID=27687 RepID=A0A8C4TG70_ERPCA|nr:potassium voltage-gated channel subfamily G member 2 isoform X2 [Erpetoichthys calabaricus]XP_028673027.1 potassium voltage-gated channel subfamily G member 2 isoform X2 [Erpetoichthys calabaricus]XP_051791671.1 potassium voltage-gated channel subfamily G member 2 isoform X2 [Erpetoichthys calabaricus]XP_051791672.1 potassium voltage-gated channel subfamily G member 2 isoform X2 [Erpetoichthys calabaricus]
MYQEMALLTSSTERPFTTTTTTAATFSFNHLENPHEIRTKKGIFYKKAKAVRPREDCYHISNLSDNRTTCVIINVGGIKYRIPWTTLDEFPLTRLGKLKTCNNYEEIMDVCDDYDVSCNEFFFDRNPSAFRTIMTFLAAGKLRLLREMCALSFREELLYWGVEEENLEWCCLRKLRQREDEYAEARRLEEDTFPVVEEPPVAFQDEVHMSGCRRRLRDMVENPHSGIPGKIFACLSIIFVAITAVTLCISTMPDLREEEEKGECSQRCHNIFVLETVCVGWFSLEFFLRFIQTQSKCVFLRTPLNIIDIMAILPYYITLIVDSLSIRKKTVGSGNNYLEKVGLVLRVLRALRILYVMRLARHSLGLQTLGLTVRRCTREFGLLLLFLCVAMALFSPLVFLAESEMGAKQEFTSIPGCYWWAVISMTTVGYGDMVPRSIPGQVVALSSILSGILLMAFPVTSIFHTFSRSYLELKEQHQRAARQKPDSQDNSKSQNSDDSQETDSSFPVGVPESSLHRKSVTAALLKSTETKPLPKNMTG